MTERRATADQNGGMRTGEQSVAMLLGIGAIVLAVIGLLRGFGMFDAGTVTLAPLTADFGAGMMWMFPALTAAILAAALAGASHRNSFKGDEPGKTAHTGAYLAGIVALAGGAISLITGFGWFGLETTFADGALWGMAAIGAGLITWGFHAAVPSDAPDEDYLVRVVETRVQAGPTGANAPAPQAERDTGA